jgi:hypothetical protein
MPMEHHVASTNSLEAVPTMGALRRYYKYIGMTQGFAYPCASPVESKL